jgi:hypothetical protein
MNASWTDGLLEPGFTVSCSVAPTAIAEKLAMKKEIRNKERGRKLKLGFL